MHYLEDLIGGRRADTAACSGEAPFDIHGKKRVNILGLGDVGGTLLTGLKLLGGDVLSGIGICGGGDAEKRYEFEMNQTAYPWDYGRLPEVEVVRREELFDCDAFVFCASKSVPAAGADLAGTDVRMAQFEANRDIIGEYAVMAGDKNFKGLFAVVSDPVDPLCRAAYLESNRDRSGAAGNKGLRPAQIQGYGLGVMNSRAAYYAKRDERFRSFLTEGRSFGPHGRDLVIANSIEHYDDALSRELTGLTVEANLRVRETGFKPYIAPALSSGAISLLLTLRGEWHYSSTCLGGVFLGARNRMRSAGVELESLPLPEALFRRIEHAYHELELIGGDHDA